MAPRLTGAPPPRVCCQRAPYGGGATHDSVEGAEGERLLSSPDRRSARMRASIGVYACLVYLYSCIQACSSRSTPKPRPPSPTARPNITFHTYACPPAYATWYCLNGATCFTVNIGESLLYNCECADGYMGQRCEFKDLDGSYLPSRQRVMLETASIAGGATIAVFLVVIVCIAVYIHFQRRLKDNRATCVDGSSHDLEKRPFSRDPREISVRRPHSQYQNSPDIPTAPIDESENDPQFIRVGEAPSTHRHSPP